MNTKINDSFDMKKMLADYMENGLLDNIVDMFKHDKNLYAYIGSLIADERIRVRIGATALLETLKKEDPANISRAAPYMLPLLKDQNPTIRGDAANLFGVIGNKDAIPFLEEMLNDTDANVRIIAGEAIEDIKTNALSV
jgi:HEAT repeat protein